MNKLHVEIWGATGYAGNELHVLMQRHPYVDTISTPSSDTEIGHTKPDVAFLALPHGASASKAKMLHALGTRVIDLSGDLRFPNAQEYERSYHIPHAAPELLPVPYGLPEINRDSIASAPIVAMPGCYPTATLLGTLPLMRSGLLAPDSMVTVDAMSGATGAGKQLTRQTHFVELYGNAVPYKVGTTHQHVGEIEQLLGHKVFFSPTLIPIALGLLTKSTVQLAEHTIPATIHETLQTTYHNAPFVNVLPEGEIPTLKETVDTPKCHIGVVAVKGHAQVISSLDNLQKGAASQAVQVFNIMQGFDETTALIPNPD